MTEFRAPCWPAMYWEVRVPCLLFAVRFRPSLAALVVAALAAPVVAQSTPLAASNPRAAAGSLRPRRRPPAAPEKDPREGDPATSRRSAS